MLGIGFGNKYFIGVVKLIRYHRRKNKLIPNTHIYMCISRPAIPNCHRPLPLNSIDGNLLLEDSAQSRNGFRYWSFIKVYLVISV